MSLRIGVDLGGTKIEVIALDDDGTELVRRRAPTPQGEYAGTLRTIASLVHGVEREAGGRASVGIGIPGTISPASGLVKNANSTWLNGRDLRADIERALARPVRFCNDANCFAVSEAADGAAAGAPVVFGVILGTGVGGGIAIDGRPLAGRNGIAGEWGHNPLPWPSRDEMPGPPCYCGRRGCIETFLSGPGLVRDHLATSGARCDPPSLVAGALAGDPACAASLDRYYDRLARALASVINILDPDVIVLGGGLSNVAPLYAQVPSRWAAYVFSDRVDTRLLQARHGDSSGVRGAAWLWPI